VRPLRLAISVAKPGDTADTLAARMAVPERPLDYFLLINDLARGEPLQRGERYKIIVE
jgi:predicted Zn-dependent protease